MPSADHGHGRTQRLLLVNKLLDSRDSASPFTLILDSLEQSARPLITEYIRRAKTNKTKVIFISFDTLRPPTGTDIFIRAYDRSPNEILQEVKSATAPSPTRTLLILSTLNALSSAHPDLPLSPFLSTLITPTASLLALYHLDQPIPTPITTTMTINPYSPTPLTLLRYLATTIMTLHPLSHVLASQSARDRSVAAPAHGLEENTALTPAADHNTHDEEGLLQGLGANDPRGVVVDVESKRRSGRGVGVTFFLPLTGGRGGGGGAEKGGGTGVKAKQIKPRQIILLDDHPLYQQRRKQQEVQEQGQHDADGAAGGDVTFNLGLTEKQRRDREGVVLPYFDAQRDEGGGEGGRILYDMGEEDDFDEEEDEI